MVYEPREDSLLLEKAVRKYAFGNVLDMGTGTGVQARAAKSKGFKVVACDIDPNALAAARNRSKGVAFIKSDLFSNIHGEFDTIIFNPPYLPDANPPDLALDGGPTGREVLDRFLGEAKGYLSNGGQILFVQSSITGIGKTKQLLIELGYSWEIVFRKRIFFEELVVFRAWKRNTMQQ